MTEDLSNQTPLVVRDALAVDVLLNLSAMRHFAPFMRAPHSLGSAAAELQVPPSSLAYWVGRLRRVGLLDVVELRQRAGKPIPIYRATSTEYRVPLEALPPGAREQFLHGGRRRMFDRFTQSIDRLAARYLGDGLRIKAHPVRGVELGLIEPKDVARFPVTEWWGVVQLTEDEAAGLQKEFEELIGRYSEREDPRRGRPHVMVVGIAPADGRVR